MTNTQRLLRLMNWVSGLTLFTLAAVICGFSTCQPAIATVISASVASKAGQETRPTPSAPDQAWEDWDTQQKPVRLAAHDVAGRISQATALFVGVPIAILLIVLSILLSRLRTRLLRGE